MPRREDVEQVKEWLKHPVTRTVAGKLRQASKGVLKRYDKVTPDELVRLQITREFLNHTLPGIIDALLIEDKKRSQWDWRKLFRQP